MLHQQIQWYKQGNLNSFSALMKLTLVGNEIQLFSHAQFCSCLRFFLSLFIWICIIFCLYPLLVFSLSLSLCFFFFFVDKMKSLVPLLQGLLKLCLNHLVTGINLHAWMPLIVATKLYNGLKTKKQQSNPTWMFEDTGTVILSFTHSAFMHSGTESSSN